MQKIIAIGIAFLTCFMFSTITFAKDYYIAKNGNDNNQGTKSKPWGTIRKANNTLSAGDTVFIRGGVYRDVIEPQRSGTASERIIYSGYLNEKATIVGIKDSKYVVAIGKKIRGNSNPNSYITVQNLNIKKENPPKGTSSNVAIIGNSKHNIIKNCRIVNNSNVTKEAKNGIKEMGILLSGSIDNLIENNYISGLSLQGIKIINGARLNTIRKNTIINNWFDAIRIGTNKNIIQGNLIEDNVLGGSIISDGIQTNQDFSLPTKSITNRGHIIRGNIIYNNAENGIDLKGAANILIEGNIIYGNYSDNDGFLGDNEHQRHGSPGGIHKGTNSGSNDIIIRYNIIYDNFSGTNLFDGWKIYNNTIIANNRDYTGSNSNYSPNAKPSFTGIKNFSGAANRASIKNNIIGNHRIGELGINMNSRVDIDYNLYFNNSQNTQLINYLGKGNWQKLTLSQWKQLLSNKINVAGNDRNSLIADPGFMNVPTFPAGNPQKFNFKLSTNSVAIDAGGPLTKTTKSGNGRFVQVADAGYFYDGYGKTEGDLIRIGNNPAVRIYSINYNNNTIEVSSAISWQRNASVNLDFSGSAPDIGASEIPDTNDNTLHPPSEISITFPAQ